jgi:RND family efflux transporter MFP subunit
MKIETKYSRILGFFTLFLGLGAAVLLAGCDSHSGAGGQVQQQKQLYTCGMHPQVVQDHPGNCPICGMKLTPIRKEGSSATTRTSGQGETVAAESQTIAIDPVTIQNMGIRTALVSRGPLRRIIRTVGVIDYNETALTDVTTKFRGWVEKLYVDATGQQVHRGEPLFEIYSPDLYSAQREYVLALEGSTNTPGGAALRASALTKLKFFDISDEQIAELNRAREPRKTLQITAPQDGFVMEKSVIEGQMVDPGTRLYRLANLSLVWVQAQIYEQDLSYIRLGQEATVNLAYLSDREFRGRVTYIYPNIDEKTRTARVRMEFHNPGYFLKPGMFATVVVASELEPSALLVPDMAVLRSGEKNTVFVALEGGRFEPRNVVLGPQAEHDEYAVISGLKEGERIVTSGQFMLDSESQLREAIQKLIRPQSAERPEEEGIRETNGVPGTTGGSEIAAAGTNAMSDVKYICPMPEHVSIQYDHPGKCPICSMTLVPVTGAALAKLQPGGKLLYFTCPMPEHSDIHLDKPGKCPKCGMTLIPVMQAPPLSPAGTNSAASNSISDTPAQLYTCPMASHADIVSDKPGKCSECNMDLVPTGTVKHGKIAEDNWRKQHPTEPSGVTGASAPHPH